MPVLSSEVKNETPVAGLSLTALGSIVTFADVAYLS